MEFVLDTILKNRKILYKILEETPIEQLNRVPKGFNNNIIWNIAHVIVTQELLVYNLSGLPMSMKEEMIEKYRKGSKVKSEVSQSEIEQIKKLLFSTFERMKVDYDKGTFQDYVTYTTSTGTTITNVDEALNFNLFHEGIHLGYILALLRSL